MTRTLKISLVTLGDPHRPTGGYLYHRRMAEAAPRHGATIKFISFPDRRFPFPAASGGQVLARAAAGDVVLLDSIAAAYVSPWSSSRHLNRPLAAIVHQPPGGIDHGPVRTRLQAWFDRRAYARCAVLLLASEALREEMPVAFADRAHVVPPGRDVASSTEPAGDLRRGRTAALLCVGNWVERKGILSLLDAFASLPPGVASLHLVGDTEADARYARKVWDRLSRSDLTGRAVVHGSVSKERVAGFFDGADAFVLASLKEPYGTVYGEAMARGLPVVGWRAGNLPHLATHEVEGLIVPPGDVGALAGALLRLARDPVLRREMGDAARRRALSFPTWDQSAERFFTELQAVAAHPA
jgi:glycosyltransferase involved in cell wall biosynthesis